MAKAKQNSAYIKPNDGRKNNGRKKGDNWQYRYGKPQDGSDNNTNKKLDVPVINFYASPNQVQNLQDTIDIESEEIDMDELNDE